MTRFAATFRALRHRNYRLFFAGQLVSLIGTWMQSVAQSWLVYRLTGSAMLLGLVGFSGQVPVLLFASLGGAVADRHDRRRVLLATQTLSMFLAGALAALTLTDHVTVAHVFILAASLGTVNAFDIPARQAFVVDMVGREDLVNGIALNSSIFNGARLAGPAIAGVLVAAIGEGWCFFANAVSYLAVIAGLLAMRMEATNERRDGRGAGPGEERARVRVGDGIRFVARTVPVRALVLLLGLVSLTGMPYAVLMPIFAGDVLHGGPGALGFLMSASGAGALLGALTLAARRDIRGLGRWVATAAGGFGLGLVCFSLSRSLWLSAAILVPTGYCMMIQMASSNTLVQVMTPDPLRGRVMAVYSMMFMGMAPFGSLIAGLAAHRLGAPHTVAAGGAVCLAGALVFARALPRLRGPAKEILEARRVLTPVPGDAG